MAIYFDELNNVWTSDGISYDSDTGLIYSTHLTEFSLSIPSLIVGYTPTTTTSSSSKLALGLGLGLGLGIPCLLILLVLIVIMSRRSSARRENDVKIKTK